MADPTAEEQAPSAATPPEAQQGPQGQASGAAPEVAGGKAEEQRRKSADLMRQEQIGAQAPEEAYAQSKAKVAPPAAAVTPLPSNLRGAMERSFGVSFAAVRLHHGSALADQLGAAAFVQGDDIHFASDAPDLRAPEGKRLLAHELAHVVQQRSGVAEEAAADPEAEADAAAAAAVAGKTAKVSRGSVPRGTLQMGTTQPAAAPVKTATSAPAAKRPPSAAAVQSATGRVQDSSVNRTGDFNVAGTARGNDYEFVNNGGKYYVRRKPQATKDAKTVAAAGGDPTSTRKPGALKPQNDSSAQLFDAKTEASAALLQTPEGGAELASGGAGTLRGEGTVLGASASASAAGSIGPDGLEVKAGAAVNLTLAAGKLIWTLPTAEFDILGEKIKAQFGTELSAEVAASAQGNVGLTAGKKDKGIAVQASGGGEAFAGARAGFKLFGKGMWVTPDGEKDFVGAFAGVEGWAGAAAAAQFTASLVPKVKFEGYLGAAVGVGASCKVGVEAHLYHIGALGYTLARKGLPLAFQGLEQYADQITDFISSGGAWLLREGAVYVGAVSTALLGDGEAIDAIDRGLHLHMRPMERAALLDKLMSGTCFDAEEDAIVRVLRDSKARGELWAVVGAVTGGADQILWKLDGEQDSAARGLLGIA